MNLKFLLLFASLGLAELLRGDVSWLPSNIPPATNQPALCPGAFLKPEQGKEVLDAALREFPNRKSWDAYAKHLRARIQQGAGLEPWPKRTPLNPIVRNQRVYDGYTVENIAFESVPGYFVTGNLYRPTKMKGRVPAILCTHGHSGRVTEPIDYSIQGRFHQQMQARCGTLARMGAIVLSIDMFGRGDSIQHVGGDAHSKPFTMAIQIWNAMRAVDLLVSLDGMDKKRIAVTGESGGGTQSFLLTALDSRVALSVPVVMVSAHFFGGCPCESGRPIHRGKDHFANNAVIAALAAPRPMLVVSCGKDWTLNTPTTEFPFLKKIYGYYGAEKNVANTHLADEGHDYGPSKREAMCRFVAEQFRLNLAAVTDSNGRIDESRVTIEKPEMLHVFNEEFPLPAGALRDAADVEGRLKRLQSR